MKEQIKIFCDATIKVADATAYASDIDGDQLMTLLTTLATLEPARRAFREMLEEAIRLSGEVESSRDPLGALRRALVFRSGQ